MIHATGNGKYVMIDLEWLSMGKCCNSDISIKRGTIEKKRVENQFPRHDKKTRLTPRVFEPVLNPNSRHRNNHSRQTE